MKKEDFEISHSEMIRLSEELFHWGDKNKLNNRGLAVFLEFFSKRLLEVTESEDSNFLVEKKETH